VKPLCGCPACQGLGLHTECSHVRLQFSESQTGGLPYLAQACSEHDDFVKLSHALEKRVNTRAFDHIDVVPLPFDFDRHHIVGLRY
jgi:hypothetical protein